MQASALDELRRLVAFMNHPVAAAASVSTPIPSSTATPAALDGPLVRSLTAWPGHASPRQHQAPAESADSLQTIVPGAGTLSYGDNDDDDDDEGLSLST